MFVSDILAEKGSLVFSARPQATVAQVAGQLSTHRIGSVLVLQDNEVVGVISERDVVRAMAQHGAAALTMEVRRIMTTDVVTCDPDDTIEHVMVTMTRGRFRHLPVMRHGELLGLVSIGDVVKARLTETQVEADALKAYIVAS